MGNKNNNNQATLFKLFVLPALCVTLASLLLCSSYVYYKDLTGFEKFYNSVKQHRLQQLQEIKTSIAQVSKYLSDPGSPLANHYPDNVSLVRGFIKEKKYTASIRVINKKSKYPTSADDSGWITLAYPHDEDIVLLSFKLPLPEASFSFLNSYKITGSVSGQSNYELFEMYHTNYEVTKSLNVFMLVWILLGSIAVGLLSGLIFMHVYKVRELKKSLVMLPNLQNELRITRDKEIQLKQRVESLTLWYKAHVYELQSAFDGVKQMGGTLNTLWQALNMNFNDYEPQYKKVMDEVSDIIDNFAHGFLLPSYSEQEVSVDECLRKIFDGKQEEMRLGRLQLEFNAPDEAMVLSCYPSVLKQILHGLVHYAIRLTPEDCKIKVRFYKDSVEVEHFGFVLKSNDYSYRNSFLSLNLTSLSYLCKKNNWSLVHKLSGPKGKQGGIFLLSFNRRIKPNIKLVHSVGS